MFERVKKLSHVETIDSNMSKMKMPGFGPSPYAGERARRSSAETGRSCRKAGRSCRKAACWFGSSSGAFSFAMVCMFPRHTIPTDFTISHHGASQCFTYIHAASCHPVPAHPVHGVLADVRPNWKPRNAALSGSRGS